MSKSETAPGSDGTQIIRAIVFKEGDVYVAQCLEFDIAAQSRDLTTVLDRLELTVEAEFEACTSEGKSPRDCIGPAPNYYHGLWDRRSHNLDRADVSNPIGASRIEMGLGQS